MEIIQGILLLTILIGVIATQASIIKEYVYKHSLMVAAVQCCFGQKGLNQIEAILQSHAEEQKALKEQEKQKKSGIFSAKKDAVMNQPANFNIPCPAVPEPPENKACFANKSKGKAMKEELFEVICRGEDPLHFTLSELKAYCDSNKCPLSLQSSCRQQGRNCKSIICGVSYKKD